MKKGFTIVEILVAVIIVALLAAFALPSFIRIREENRTKIGIINFIRYTSILNTNIYFDDVPPLRVSRYRGVVYAVSNDEVVAQFTDTLIQQIAITNALEKNDD